MMTCSRHNQIKSWGNRPCVQKYRNLNSVQKELNLYGLYFLRYLEYLSFEVPRCRPFWKDTHKNIQKTRDAIGKEILVCFIKLVSICTRSQHRVFSLPCWPRVWMEWFREACTTSRSDNFQPFRLCFVTYRMKLDEVDFVDEEFLPKKINKREDFTDYDVAVDILEDTSI